MNLKPVVPVILGVFEIAAFDALGDFVQELGLLLGRAKAQLHQAPPGDGQADTRRAPGR